MHVTLWAVLGLVLLLWGLPFAFLSLLPYSTGQLNFTAGITVGAGIAFLFTFDSRVEQQAG